MQDAVLPHVIFSPGVLAKQLAEGLQAVGHEVFLFTPGPLTTSAHNITSDTTLFEAELAARGDSAVSLLKKHPLTFITLSRQLQAELIAKAYKMANEDQLDIVHIYTNEEELALPFAPLCHKPVVFTHHDPFNFLVRYKAVMPKYAGANWLSLSFAQRQTMPKDTNWIANIYHGLDPKSISIGKPDTNNPYILFLGRIIEAKGLHLAIKAVQLYNKTAIQPLRLKIAGKHYAGQKDLYWQSTILPLLNDPFIEYLGFVGDQNQKNKLLAGAQALIIPSVFTEPFGMVMIESLAASTPVIGLDSGAISEVVKDGHTGFIVPLIKRQEDRKEVVDESRAVQGLAKALKQIETINRKDCRADFEARFTLDRMVNDHIAAYKKLVK
ncbi:MAG: glycosyltransferase [Candidatus Saccharibacteria bacterium]|nr:glycosyltransferase [Candidatus Saccharibacteria bacterium]